MELVALLFSICIFYGGCIYTAWSVVNSLSDDTAEYIDLAVEVSWSIFGGMLMWISYAGTQTITTSWQYKDNDYEIVMHQLI